jgi:hypothetical protein
MAGVLKLRAGKNELNNKVALSKLMITSKLRGAVNSFSITKKNLLIKVRTLNCLFMALRPDPIRVITQITNSRAASASTTRDAPPKAWVRYEFSGIIYITQSSIAWAKRITGIVSSFWRGESY